MRKLCGNMRLFHRALNRLSNVPESVSLEINMDETKVMVFDRKRTNQSYDSSLSEQRQIN